MNIAMKHITIAGIFLCSLVCAQAYASIYEGKVVGVTDGDTLTVLTAQRQQIGCASPPAASLPRALRRASAANGEDVRCGCSFSHHRADAGTSAGLTPISRRLPICRQSGFGTASSL